jgi:hypothetical protein
MTHGFYFYFRRLQTDPKTVFYHDEIPVEMELSQIDHDHEIVSVGKMDVMKLGTIFAKHSPLKPMFDQVKALCNKIEQVYIAALNPPFQVVCGDWVGWSASFWQSG